MKTTYLGVLVSLLSFGITIAGVAQTPAIEHNTWSSGAPMLTATAPSGVGVLEDQIYVFDTETAQIYDPATNTWTTGPSLPAGADGVCAAVEKNVLYFFGANASWAYSPKEGWTGIAPIPSPIGGAFRCAVAHGTIFIFGGWSNYQFLTTVYGYNRATNTWTVEAYMLNPESDGAAETVSGMIIVTDASDGWVDGNNQEYDPATNTWIWLNPDPTLRQSTCAGSYSGRLYSAGGWNAVQTNGTPALTLTESFTLSTDKWKTLASMPQGTMNSAGIFYKGRLYCFGGNSSVGGSALNSVWIYQP